MKQAKITAADRKVTVAARERAEELVYHVHVVQVRGGGLVGQVDGVLQGDVPDGEGLELARSSSRPSWRRRASKYTSTILCRLLIFSKNTFLFYHIFGGMGMGKLIFWGRIV